MKRTTIFLHEEMESDLKAVARRRSIPVAEVVREAIHDYVARERRRPAGLPGFVAVGASGRSDGAERHEELLWETLQPHEKSVAVKPRVARRVPNPRRAARPS